MGRRKIEIDLEEVTRLAARGLTQEQIAAALGISASTLGNRKAESSELVEAIKKGQAQGIAAVANSLWDNAMSGNVTAQIFFLKARAKWKDKHEGDPEEDVEPAPVKVEVTVSSARKNADA